MRTILVLVLSLIIALSYCDDRQDVIDAQYLYNYRADQVFNNLRGNGNNLTVNHVLDELVSSFCPDQFFVSWTANDAGTVNTTAGVRAMYEFLGKNIFNNDSTHQLSGVIASVSGNRASVTANIFTWLNLKIDPNPPFFSLARGFYNNEFRRLNGRWCMSKFVAYTLHQGNLDYNVTINFPFPFDMIPSN